MNLQRNTGLTIAVLDISAYGVTAEGAEGRRDAGWPPGAAVRPRPPMTTMPTLLRALEDEVPIPVLCGLKPLG